jgi:FkbM family methyltransferase
MTPYEKLPCLFKNLGAAGSALYLFRRFGGSRILMSRRPFPLFSKYSRHPVLCRPGTSDLAVFGQIFIEREYRCIDDLANADLVIDCGANIGLSSAYFLSRFPNCHVIAVEPDPGNYAMMEVNLKPYETRVQMLNAAVWSHTASLTISEAPYRGGAEWARQVRECQPGEKPMFPATDIGSLLKSSGRSRISILKIDIEGAEGVLFSSPGYQEWIDKTDVLLIELHDDSSFGKCSEIFFSAVKDCFKFSRYDELTVCRRF